MDRFDSADVIEVRTSYLKLIGFSLCFSPAIIVLFFFPAWSIYLLRTGQTSELIATWEDLWALYLFCALLFILLIDLWMQFATPKPILKLTPKGLVVPLLGSAKPIPWRNVKATMAPGPAGDVSFYLDLNADPNEYPYLFGRTPLTRLLHQPRILLFPVLNVSVTKLFDKIVEYTS